MPPDSSPEEDPLAVLLQRTVDANDHVLWPLLPATKNPLAPLISIPGSSQQGLLPL